MFVGFDRSRWIQELDELDRIINENLEKILEQRGILASLDVGREADLIGEFLEELLGAPNVYCRSRAVAYRITLLTSVGLCSGAVGIISPLFFVFD